MRKRSNRIRRPLAKLLTPAQHADLMIAPRMHLELVLNQTANIHYQKSVAGVLNISGVLAHMHGNAQLQTNFDNAQKVLVELIGAQRSPTSEEGSVLRQAFNQADSYIGIQNTLSMAKAIRYVDREIMAGRSTVISTEIGE